MKHYPAVAAILLVGGVLILALGLSQLPAAIKSFSWQSTEGRITRYRLESEIRGKQIVPRYSVAVDYKFRVGESEYAGGVYSHTSSSIGPSHPSQQDAIHEYLHDPRYNKWQPGQRITVYFNADKPSDAVLKTGATSLGWLLCGLGVFIAAIGLREFLVIRRLRVSVNTRSTPSA